MAEVCVSFRFLYVYIERAVMVYFFLYENVFIYIRIQKKEKTGSISFGISKVFCTYFLSHKDLINIVGTKSLHFIVCILVLYKLH